MFGAQVRTSEARQQVILLIGRHNAPRAVAVPDESSEPGVDKGLGGGKFENLRLVQSLADVAQRRDDRVVGDKQNAATGFGAVDIDEQAAP